MRGNAEGFEQLHQVGVVQVVEDDEAGVDRDFFAV